MEDDTSKTVEFEYVGTKMHSGLQKWIPVHRDLFHIVNHRLIAQKILLWICSGYRLMDHFSVAAYVLR